MITFLPLSPDDLPRVAHIAVHPEQVVFSGTIQEAFDTPTPDMDAYAIQQDGDVVGFFRIDRAYSQIHSFAPPTGLGLRTVMVDASRQGMGVGRSLCQMLPAYLQEHYPRACSLWLTVNLRNPGAVRAYVKGGFVDTGEHWLGGDAGPQHIMKMSLRVTSTANPLTHAG